MKSREELRQDFFQNPKLTTFEVLLDLRNMLQQKGLTETVNTTVDFSMLTGTGKAQMTKWIKTRQEELEHGLIRREHMTFDELTQWDAKRKAKFIELAEQGACFGVMRSEPRTLISWGKGFEQTTVAETSGEDREEREMMADRIVDALNMVDQKGYPGTPPQRVDGFVMALECKVCHQLYQPLPVCPAEGSCKGCFRTTVNLVNRDSLLQQLAEAIGRQDPSRVKDLEVTVHVDHGDGSSNDYSFDLTSALHMLASDLYWDQRGNWCSAKRVTVRSF